MKREDSRGYRYKDVVEHIAVDFGVNELYEGPHFPKVSWMNTAKNNAAKVVEHYLRSFPKLKALILCGGPACLEDMDIKTRFGQIVDNLRIEAKTNPYLEKMRFRSHDLKIMFLDSEKHDKMEDILASLDV